MHWEAQGDGSLQFAIILDYYTKHDTIYWRESSQERSPKNNLSSLNASYSKATM